MYNYDINKENAKLKLKFLQDNFDKEYVKDMFDAMRESGIEELNENMIYEHKGYVYILRRQPKLAFGGMLNVPRKG